MGMTRKKSLLPYQPLTPGSDSEERNRRLVDAAAPFDSESMTPRTRNNVNYARMMYGGGEDTTPKKGTPARAVPSPTTNSIRVEAEQSEGIRRNPGRVTMPDAEIDSQNRLRKKKR